jgi:DNA-binding transcriptional regulator of glucitol operon
MYGLGLTRYAQVVMTVRKRSRLLLWRLLSALFLVLVFAGVAWDENGGGDKHLAIDLAIGVGATAVIAGTWWLAKRFVNASKRALRQGYRDALTLESHYARRLAEVRTRASRPEYRDAMVREAARRAGRFVGSARRAFREGYGDTRQQDR